MYFHSKCQFKTQPLVKMTSGWGRPSMVFFLLLWFLECFKKYIYCSKINHVVFNKIIGRFYKFERSSLLLYIKICKEKEMWLCKGNWGIKIVALILMMLILDLVKRNTYGNSKQIASAKVADLRSSGR